MKKILITFIIIFMTMYTYSQSHINQSGWRSSVTNTLAANSEQAMRYEIATLGYNSFHWQAGGLIIIELFHQSFSTGYEKYIVENGYAQGANHGNPSVKLIESRGLYHLAKIAIGNPYDLGSSHGGYINKALPIYLDVRYYAGYKVKLTYLQDNVDVLTEQNQIKVNIAPAGTPLADFAVSSFLDGDLMSKGRLTVIGDGNHYIENGNVGIGTTDPKGYKLAVNGKIRAQEIKVEATPWPDYVFVKDYPLPTLQQTEKHIKEKGHLPGIPSASEVKANGINVGEMNAKLLQKIEELTLHLIEMKKENTGLKQLAQEQDVKINLIMSKLNNSK